MKGRLGLLRINKVILHQVPRRIKDADIGPEFSDVESPLDPELKALFRERIIGSASSSVGYAVSLAPDSPSPMPTLISDYLAGTPMDFVAMSKTMAQHLFESQSAVNSNGVLAVIDCTFDDLAGICIMKLEREEGARLERSQVDGRSTFNIQHLKDIMLTTKTRLYKLGIFSMKRRVNPTIEGIVCDEQRSYQPRTEVANFFLRDFLGCQLTVAPNVATKRFFEETERFINEHIEDPIRRAECINHLVSELTNQRNVISAEQFARAYLHPDERQAYLSLVTPKIELESFPKNIELISSRIGKISMEFASGIRIVGQQNAIDEKVKLVAAGNGLTRAELVDELKEIRTRK